MTIGCDLARRGFLNTRAAAAIAINITKGAPSDQVKAAMEPILQLSKNAKVRQSARRVLAGAAGKR